MCVLKRSRSAEAEQWFRRAEAIRPPVPTALRHYGECVSVYVCGWAIGVYISLNCSPNCLPLSLSRFCPLQMKSLY